MRKKRFYNNKKRGKKWTEEPMGRKIYFADKYIPGENSNTDNPDKKTKKPFFTRENGEKFLRTAIIAVCGFVVIGIGYTVMDIHLELNAMPYSENQDSDSADLSSININLRGTDCQPLSLDAGVMLSAVMDTAAENGYTSLAFDLKRNDGTIGYASTLAAVDAYGAVSSPSGDLQGSVSMLKENDILPIGRISCYRDNIVPAADLTAALTENGSVYRDKGGNTYLNPDSQSTYSYIKSIVEEAVNAGITVFLLDNYNLPDEISANYGDGFDAIADRLYKDFGSDIKLLRAVDLNITANDEKAVEKEWQEKTEKLDTGGKNAVYCITAKNKSETKQFLDNSGISNYIIFE